MFISLACVYPLLRLDEQVHGKDADLEEDGLSINPPKVGDGVTTVTTTWEQLQSRITAWTQFLWNTQTPVR